MKNMKEFSVLTIELLICLGVVLIVSFLEVFKKREGGSEQEERLKDIAWELKERLECEVKKAQASSQVKITYLNDRSAQRVTARWGDGGSILEAKIGNYEIFTVETADVHGVKRQECSGINHLFQVSESSLRIALSADLIGVD